MKKVNNKVKKIKQGTTTTNKTTKKHTHTKKKTSQNNTVTLAGSFFQQVCTNFSESSSLVTTKDSLLTPNHLHVLHLTFCIQLKGVLNFGN